MGLKKEKLCELRPNRKLIDSNFESYKLSLDQMSYVKTQFSFGLALISSQPDVFSYEKTKCIFTHNYLTIDNWYPDNVFFVDKNMRIRRFHLYENRIDPAQLVFPLEKVNSVAEDAFKLPPSLLFPSELLSVASDGLGTFYVFNTKERKFRENDKWKMMYKNNCDKPVIVLDARFYIVENIDHIDVLIAEFEERKPSDDDKEKVEFTMVILRWYNLKKVGESFELVSCRVFEGKSYPDYVALDKNGLSISSNTPFKLIESEDENIQMETCQSANESKKIFKYKWKQTTEDLTIMIQLPANASTKHVACSISPKKLNIGIRSDLNSEPVTIISGQLYFESDPEASNWSIEDGQLLVCIQKRAENQTWPQLLDGDDEGEYIVDPEEVERVHNQLKHLTSEKMDEEMPGDDNQNLFNGEQLEECDSYYNKSATLKYFSSNENAFTQSVDISSLKWLFNCKLDPKEPSAIVLRHDVDAIVWQPFENSLHTANSTIWRHMTTHNALGYVQASKTNLRFITASPDSTYVALCECQRRIYIYRQPSPLINASLRNRTEGRQVSKISKQQVAVLDTNENIHGFCASSQHLFVCTESELYVYNTSCNA